MTTEQDPLVEHQLKLEVQEKRHALAGLLPGLAVRIFALGGRHYPGCGFHYDMVKSIGHLLHRINDYDRGLDLGCMITLEVIYNGLVEQVETAEKAVAGQTGE